LKIHTNKYFDLKQVQDLLNIYDPPAAVAFHDIAADLQTSDYAGGQLHIAPAAAVVVQARNRIRPALFDFPVFFHQFGLNLSGCQFQLRLQAVYLSRTFFDLFVMQLF
jgi:hypothetical protein